MRSRLFSGLLTFGGVLLVDISQAIDQEGEDSPPVTVACRNLDIVQLQDASDSFKKNKQSKAEIVRFGWDVVEQLGNKSERAVRVGLASFVDKPYGLVGLRKGSLLNQKDDWEFKLIKALTLHKDDFTPNLIEYGGGGDPEESHLSAIHRLMKEPDVNWSKTPGKTTVLIVVTNSMFHKKGDLAKSQEMYEAAWKSGELCDLIAEQNRPKACEYTSSLTVRNKLEYFGPQQERAIRGGEEYPTEEATMAILKVPNIHLIVVLVNTVDDSVDEAWKALVVPAGGIVISSPHLKETIKGVADAIDSFKECQPVQPPTTEPLIVPVGTPKTEAGSPLTIPPVPKPHIDVPNKKVPADDHKIHNGEKKDDIPNKKGPTEDHKIHNGEKKEDGLNKKFPTDEKKEDGLNKKFPTDEKKENGLNKKVPTDEKTEDELNKKFPTDKKKDDGPNKKVPTDDHKIHNGEKKDDGPNKKVPTDDHKIHNGEKKDDGPDKKVPGGKVIPSVQPGTLPSFNENYSPKTAAATTTDTTTGPIELQPEVPIKPGMGSGAIAGAAVGGAVGVVAVGAALMKGIGGSMFGHSGVPDVAQTTEANGQNPQMERETLEAIDADMFA